MLGLVRHKGATVLHLRDAHIRVMGVLPVLVRAFVPRMLLELGQVLSRRCFDPFGLGRSFQILVVAFTALPRHDAAQSGVRLQSRGIDRHGLPLEQAFLGQHLQHPGEDLLPKMITMYVKQRLKSAGNRRLFLL